MEFHKIAVIKCRACSDKYIEQQFVCMPSCLFKSFYIDPPAHLSMLASPQSTLILNIYLHVPISCLKHLLTIAHTVPQLPCNRISHSDETCSSPFYPFLSVLQDFEWFLQWPINQGSESSIFRIVFLISRFLGFVYVGVIYWVFCLSSLFLC